MDNQLIIAISREYGSGGHEIGRNLAQRFDIAFYDRNLLDEIAAEKEVNVNRLKKYDEVPKRPMIHRTVRGMSNSPEEIIAQFQFDFLRQKAQNGESFVVVGRCAEEILKDCSCLVRFFVLADEEYKLQRCQEKHKTSRNEAKLMMTRHDWNRKAYHNSHCQIKWGDSRGYDMCINSSKLGLEGTADIMERFVRTWMVK